MLGSLAASVAGSIASGAVSSFFDRQNSAYQTGLSLNASKKLFKYQNSNKYQFMVNDLRQAGLNPVLAVGGMQGSSGGVISPGNSNTDIQGINNAMAQRAQIRVAEKNAETEWFKAQADAFNALSQAEWAKAQANNLNIMTPVNSALAQAQIDYLGKQMEEIDNNFKIALAQLNNDTRLTDAQINKLVADVFHINAMTGTELLSTEKLKKELYGKEATYQKDYLDTLFGEIQYKFGYGLSLMTQGLGGAGFKLGDMLVRTK